jgi:hypothetical protein
MFNVIVSKEASDHDGRRAQFFSFFFHNLAQKNFLGCCPVSAGEDELIRSIDLFCRIIGDNPKKFLSFFFLLLIGRNFFSPTMFGYILAGRSWHHADGVITEPKYASAQRLFHHFLDSVF